MVIGVQGHNHLEKVITKKTVIEFKKACCKFYFVLCIDVGGLFQGIADAIFPF